LNTFGYGYDHDTKIMNRLANLRDGSYYFVEDYKKVGEYFTNILGGCINNISNKSELEVKILNEKSKIVKVFGKDKLYPYELTNSTFKNKMLQFISGKEYTTVLEIFIDESNVKPGDILLEVNFKYEDIMTKKEIAKVIISVLIAALTALAAGLGLTSCNVTRTITTRSEAWQKGDTSVIIQSKTVESYDGSRK
jgi:hypothetical protein